MQDKIVEYMGFTIQTKPNAGYTFVGAVLLSVSDMSVEGYAIKDTTVDDVRCMFANENGTENWRDLSNETLSAIHMFGSSFRNWLELKQTPIDEKPFTKIGSGRNSFISSVNKILTDINSPITLYGPGIYQHYLYYRNGYHNPADTMKALYYSLVGFPRAVK